MGMIGIFISVTTKELNSYLKDSSLLEDRLDNELENGDPAFFDVDKSWDSLSYLINGVPQQEIRKAKPPLSWVIFGDKKIDPKQDLGYGPGSYLTDKQVKEVHKALQQLSTEDLLKNYDAAKLNELKIYPLPWKDSKELKEHSDFFLNNLQSFYAKAAENNHGVICFIG